MTDKIIKFNGFEFYVLDEIIVDRRIYLFAIQVDNASEIVSDKCIVCEVKFDKTNILIDNINDVELQKKINDIFISRMKK